MTRILILLFCSLIFHKNLFAQSQLVKQWDYRYGGIGNEELGQMISTLDSGFVICGTSFSQQPGGDKTQANWSGFADFWVVKTNSGGIKQWDKRFGGLNYEVFKTVQQTNDGGYILGGYSYSGIGGDRTESAWDPTNMTNDYWIIKIDASGIKQWDKRFGGNTYDNLQSVEQTIDGGYILGGSSRSGMNGDKTQPNWDTNHLSYDYWIVKIDDSGNKQWDKRYGGVSSDYLIALKQTTDGEYILAGHSLSGANGDKSQPSWGSIDYWIVKIDSLGNKIWDKTYGGNVVDQLHSLHLTADGGYLLGGLTFSGISGNKSQPNWDASLSTQDLWIVKTDSSGNILWDRDFGTVGAEDEFGNITQTPDGGYLFFSATYYPDANGDKTEDNLGFEQMWAVKTNSFGYIQWEKTIFTDGHDEAVSSSISNYGCYAFAGYTNAGVSGYKSQPGWDTTGNNYDYWIIKFCDTTLVSSTIIQNTNESDLVSVSPNPFSSEITISIKKQNLKQSEFTIKNNLGQIVFNETENNPGINFTKTINLSSLPKGIYLLEVSFDGERIVNKILRE